MSTVCVNGKQLKIYHKNIDGTITLTKQFKPLLNLLYYFPDTVTNALSGCLLVDEFTLPSVSKSTLHGESTPSGFLSFTGNVDGPAVPRGSIDVDILLSLLDLEFRWEVKTHSPCVEDDIEVRFMSYIESQFFDANGTFPMIDTNNNFTIFHCNKGKFSLPLEWTDQFYVWVNVPCSMVLTVSARVPKPFLVPPMVRRKLVDQNIPVNDTCVTVYTLRLPKNHFDLVQNILPDFQKAARKIHDTIVYYSIPYPLTSIPRSPSRRVFDTLKYTGGLFTTSDNFGDYFYVGVTRGVTKNQFDDIAVPARLLEWDKRFYGIETITPDPVDNFHMEVELEYSFMLTAMPFHQTQMRCTKEFISNSNFTIDTYTRGKLQAGFLQQIPVATITFTLPSSATQFGFYFYEPIGHVFTPISISTTVIEGHVP